MANPALTGDMTVTGLSTSIKISTATTNENILANKASSGKLIRVDLLIVHNVDGSSAATFQLKRYNQDGTGMNSNTGANEVAIGSDVVAGSDLGGPHNISVAAQASQVMIDKTMGFTLLEDESLILQASAANDLDVWLVWTVLG